MSHKLLVVDDDALLTDTLSRVLKGEDIEVTVASTGEEGLEKLSSDAPDLVLVDLLMPTMSGTDFLKELQHSGTEANVIIVSNLDDDEKKQECMDLGAADFVLKSRTSLKELQEVIKRHLL